MKRVRSFLDVLLKQTKIQSHQDVLQRGGQGVDENTLLGKVSNTNQFNDRFFHLTKNRAIHQALRVHGATQGSPNGLDLKEGVIALFTMSQDS